VNRDRFRTDQKISHISNALEFKDIEPLLDGIKCIGFDVFDTLILRPFMKPADLFSYLEDKESAEGFRRERVNAE